MHKSTHFVSGHPLRGPWPEMQTTSFGMGCFWGAERLLWKTPGVFVTAAGYQGGRGDHPTYEQVCRLETGHVEVVKVVWEPGLAVCTPT